MALLQTYVTERFLLRSVILSGLVSGQSRIRLQVFECYPTLVREDSKRKPGFSKQLIPLFHCSGEYNSLRDEKAQEAPDSLRGPLSDAFTGRLLYHDQMSASFAILIQMRFQVVLNLADSLMDPNIGD